MSKIKVLIVDDSVVVRTLVSEVLSSDANIEVVGLAANGKIAVQKITQVNPDLVTLDIEMPVMDGLTALKEIRKLKPRLPVIMFSTLTARGAAITLEALSAGASDYVAKPANVGSVMEGKQVLKSDLVPKIYSLCGIIDVPRKDSLKPIPLAPAQKAEPVALRVSTPKKVDAVVIGVSTGGPNALENVIPLLPASMPVPVVVVQHMPPVFTKSLAERLNSKSAVEVREGGDGDVITPGTVWIAPGGKHLEVMRDGSSVVRLRTTENPPENSCRPAVDVLFRSAVKVYGQNLLGVVMTGMGQDGLKGCELIADQGGQIVVQDEATSVVWGMPGFVARAGLADKVLPVTEIANEISRRVVMQRSVRG